MRFAKFYLHYNILTQRNKSEYAKYPNNLTISSYFRLLTFYFVNNMTTRCISRTDKGGNFLITLVVKSIQTRKPQQLQNMVNYSCFVGKI